MMKIKITYTSASAGAVVAQATVSDFPKGAQQQSLF